MKKLALTLGFYLLLSCTGEQKGDERILWVYSSKEECSGADPLECLLVQKTDTLQPGTWERFFSPVEGFEYEAGYIYKLQVLVTELNSKEAPAGATPLRYDLVKVLEKKEDLRLQLNGSWILSAISGLELAELDIPRAELHFEVAAMSYHGNDGCNALTGQMNKICQEEISFGFAAATRMMCPDMQLANIFGPMLAEVSSYKVSDGTLILISEEGSELMKFEKKQIHSL